MKRNTEKSAVQRELEKLSPLLAELRERDAGFVVPENYFQDLTDKILERALAQSGDAIAEVEERKYGRRRALISFLQTLLRPRYALAATALAILIIAGLFWLTPSPDALPGEVAWSDISTEEMTRYVEANIHEFDLDALVEIAPPTETQSIFKDADIDQETLDNYLEEIIDQVEIEELENLF